MRVRHGVECVCVGGGDLQVDILTSWVFFFFFLRNSYIERPRQWPGRWRQCTVIACRIVECDSQV